MKTSEILAKAADIIDERGLAYEIYIDNAGKVCSVGAIRIVCGGTVTRIDNQIPHIDTSTLNTSDSIRARKALEYYLATENQFDYAGEHITEWNDRNTKEMVVQAFRGAAEYQKGRENG